MIPANFTKAQINKIAKNLTPTVNALLTATAKAEAIREKINAMDLELIRAVKYPIAAKHFDRRDNLPEFVETINQTYMMTDEAAVDYYEAREARIEADGWDVSVGYCPAAMAEHDRIKLENKLINETCAAIDCKKTANDIWQTELRKRFIELAVQLVMNCPGYVAELV